MKIEPSLAMWHRAERLIAADVTAACGAANPSHNPHGKRRAKPYRVSDRARRLTEAMGKGDAELMSSIMLNDFMLPYSTDWS